VNPKVPNRSHLRMEPPFIRSRFGVQVPESAHATGKAQPIGGAVIRLTGRHTFSLPRHWACVLRLSERTLPALGPLAPVPRLSDEQPLPCAGPAGGSGAPRAVDSGAAPGQGPPTAWSASWRLSALQDGGSEDPGPAAQTQVRRSQWLGDGRHLRGSSQEVGTRPQAPLESFQVGTFFPACSRSLRSAQPESSSPPEVVRSIDASHRAMMGKSVIVRNAFFP
jgi:hypothetical protein